MSSVYSIERAWHHYAAEREAEKRLLTERAAINWAGFFFCCWFFERDTLRAVLIILSLPAIIMLPLWSSMERCSSHKCGLCRPLKPSVVAEKRAGLPTAPTDLRCET